MIIPPVEEKVLTKKKTSIEEVAEFLNIKPSDCIKTLIIKTASGYKALALRGDHELNEIKVQNLWGEFEFATDDEIKRLDLKKGFIGVNALSIDLVVDYTADVMCDFVCGANEWDYHLTGANCGDIEFESADLRNAVAVQNFNTCTQALLIQLVCQSSNTGRFIIINRHNHQLKRGNTGRKNDAFIIIILLNCRCHNTGYANTITAHRHRYYNKSTRVRALADELYQQCLSAGIEVLLDDRKERAGIMFADSELLGIPHREFCSIAAATTRVTPIP
jgi:prolyl-tRNA synthetase